MIEFTCQANAQIGENTVAIAFDDCTASGLRVGSPVVVVGNKKTVAQLVVNEHAPAGQVLMCATMRLNADVNEGDEVRLQQLPAQALQRIRFQPTSAGLDEDTFQAAVRQLKDV